MHSNPFNVLQSILHRSRIAYGFYPTGEDCWLATNTQTVLKLEEAQGKQCTNKTLT